MSLFTEENIIENAEGSHASTLTYMHAVASVLPVDCTEGQDHYYSWLEESLIELNWKSIYKVSYSYEGMYN